MKSDVGKIAVFATLQQLSKVDRQQLRRFRRRRRVVVTVVVFDERILDDISSDFFDFVQTVFDRVSERTFRRFHRRRRQRRFPVSTVVVVTNVRTSVARSEDRSKSNVVNILQV